MKLPTIKFVFDRKHVADSFRSKNADRKKGLLQLEVYYDGKRKWYSTGVKLYNGQWDDSRFVINHQESLELNQTLHSLLSRIQVEIASSVEHGKEFSFSAMDKIVDGSNEGKKTLVEAIYNHSEKSKSMGDSYSTYMIFSALSTKISEWLSTINKQSLRPDELTGDMIKMFDIWMVKSGLSEMTRFLYHQKMKKVMNDLVKSRVVSSSPYADIEIKKPKEGKPRYLTIDEIEKIKKHKTMRKNERFVIDLFLFQSYTGLAYSDAIGIVASRDIVKEDGKFILRDERVKSGVDFAIEIMPQAMEILDRNGGTLNRYSLQNINTLLNRVGLDIIGKKLTTHMARHSFATNALSLGVPIEYVSKMLGHKNIITTQRYAKVLAKDVIKQFDKLKKL